jgi:alpha-D-xyloside xylohydrolase
MKFTDGFWRNREGFSVYNAARVYDLEYDEATITAYAPYHDVQNRGQTLDGPVITVRLSSPAEGVIRVQAAHFTGARKRSPRFVDAGKAGVTGKAVAVDDDAAVLTSGALQARLSRKGPWSLEFAAGETSLVNSGVKNLGYVLDPDGRPYMKEQLSLGVGELVYGLGERFTHFTKNGQVIDSWNADGGTASELAYKTIPFYLTNRGYGVFVNDPGAVSFEVGSEKVARVQFSAPGEYLDYFVIYGPTPKEVLERYTALTGRPALPPAWSFGLWLSTSFVTDYDEATVSSFVDGMAERDIPLHVFHFDCFWMREYTWTSFLWDKRWFPDPEGFLARLKAKGLKICVWINPYIAQRSELFAEAVEKGYLLKRTDGSVYQVDTWQPGMGFVDFTNPDAREWYAKQIEGLLDIGVDTVKTDFGERIPTEDATWFDGSTPENMHNYYSHLYNRTVFETLERRRGKGDAVVFARSATVGGQQFPVHWGGDCEASYESMAESLRGGLSLGLCGFGFWSHDISGFEHTATPALYKRWAAFGLLSSHSRLHGNASYRVPWDFDEEAVDVLRFFTRLKCRLMPYLWTVAQEAQLGIPMMRAVLLEFPDDPATAYLDRQYMLGESILVAPVFSDAAPCEFYLPSGRWTHLLSGESVDGGVWRSEVHDFLSLPLYVREGGLIAFGSRDDSTDYDFADRAELVLYNLQDGGHATCTVYSPDGSAELEVEVVRNELVLDVTARGVGKPWTLRIAESSAEPVEGRTGTFQVRLDPTDDES